MKVPIRFRCKNTRAVALIVTLSVIVLLAVLAVSLVTAMRMDRQASHYYAERVRAEFLAREAVEYVRASITEATRSGHQWISMPGRVVSSSNNLAGSSVQIFDLHSGLSTAAVSSNVLDAPDINRVVLSDDRMETIAPGATNQMRIKWIYVRKSGLRETNQSPATTNQSDPIVGRFAYWADDESARIDLNTAWKRGQSTGETNSNSINHPSRVNLLALPGMTEEYADEIHAIATNTAFNSPDEIRRYAPLADVFSSNRFYLSHYAFSSALNPWGDPKIILTTKTNNLTREILDLGSAATNYYFAVSGTNNSADDAGWYSSMTTDGVIGLLNRLYQTISTNVWPYTSETISQKYPDELTRAQIAIDLVEYVRSAESTNTFVYPLRMTFTNGAFSFADTTSSGSNIIVGSPRRPMFSEFGVWCSEIRTNNANPANPLLQMDVITKAEVCIPTNYINSLDDLIGLQINVAFRRPRVLPETSIFSVGGINYDYPDPHIKTYYHGKYLYLVVEDDLTTYGSRPNSTNVTFTNRPTEFWIRGQVLPPASSPGGKSGFGSIFYDVAPAAFDNSTPENPHNYTNLLIKVPVNGLMTNNAPVPIGQISSAQASDPRVNKYQANWTNAPNTFGEMNVMTKISGVFPPQDTVSADSSSDLSDASLYQPPRKGLPGNKDGIVRSVAELGYIPSGVGANIPWRSLRFQPTPGATASTLPDWALADLFTAPYFTNSNPSLYRPQTNSFAGRINLNSHIFPFTNMVRHLPTEALFRTNVAGSTDAQTLQIVTNVAERTAAANGRLFGGTNGYVSAGELAEIRGIADAGEPSEQNLFGIIDLAATQGGVFRVYAVAQALKQTPQGKLVVQAESSVMSIIERQPDGTSRTIFWKVLPL